MNKRINTELLYIKSMKPHFHIDELELLLVLRGNLTVFRMEKQIKLSEGQFTFINCRSVHYLISDGAYVLSTRIRLREFKYIYDRIEYVDFLNRDELTENPGSLTKRVGMAITDFIIKDYQLTALPELSDEKEFYENQLVHLLFNSYQTAFSLKKEDESLNRNMMDRYYAVVEYITNHVREKLNAETILQMFYMHPNYFSQFMKKAGGIGFKDLVSYRKLAEIEMLLLHEEYSLADIAEQMDFIDMKAFYHIFKKYFHTSPSKWREQLLKIEDNWQICHEQEVFDTYILQHHIHQHQDNHMAKLYRYLLECQEKHIDLSDMDIIIDPYKDMGTDSTNFQPYKYSTPLLYLIRNTGAHASISYPVKVMRREEDRIFLTDSIKGLFRSHGEAEVKKWKFILRIDDGADAALAKELKNTLLELGLVQVRIMMTGMNL